MGTRLPTAYREFLLMDILHLPPMGVEHMQHHQPIKYLHALNYAWVAYNTRTFLKRDGSKGKQIRAWPENAGLFKIKPDDPEMNRKK